MLILSSTFTLSSRQSPLCRTSSTLKNPINCSQREFEHNDLERPRYSSCGGRCGRNMSPCLSSPHPGQDCFDCSTIENALSPATSSVPYACPNALAADELTPLLRSRGASFSMRCLEPNTTTIQISPNGSPHNRCCDTANKADSEYSDESDLESKKWSKWRHLKTTLLSLVIVYTLISFIVIPEHREQWTSLVVQRGQPVYVNITSELDVINPVWTIKAKSRFLPAEYDNFSDSDVVFSIIRIKDGQQVGRFEQPWIVPIAPSNLSVQMPLKEVKHSFIMSSDSIESPTVTSDTEFFEHIFDADSSYQLELTTTDKDAVAVSLNISAYSDLSLKGIIMAGVVLAFLYTLIIFEVVHRTLAAMIGATAAIACLTLVKDRPSLERVVSWLDIETLALLFGMMIMVAILCETGFFDYVAVLAFRLAKGQTWPLIVILCLFTAFLSAFLDNVTTILLMTPVTIRLCEINNIDPKHVLIAQVVFSNIGGASTPVGDPPNVIIINSQRVKDLGIDFTTFTMHLMPGILLCVGAAFLVIRFLYRDVSKLGNQEPPELVGKKRLMEYLKKEVNDMEESDKPSPVSRQNSKRGNDDLRQRYHDNIQIPNRTPCENMKTNSIDTILEATPVCQKSHELKHEIEVWKKASQSIPGYTRDENSVRGVLNRKVLALENVLRKHLYDDINTTQNYEENLAELTRKYNIKNKTLLVKSGIVMLCVIMLFFLQSMPNMDISLGWIAVLGAIALLTLADFDELESIIGRVEWSTLLFFASLFVVMEVLDELRFLWWIGQLTKNAINYFSEDNKLLAAIIIILWVSALSSSLIDNIPFATVMIKIVEDLAKSDDINLPITPLVYALAFGACLGGNGTLIGASANVVCAGVAEQHGYRFTFMDFFKVGFPIMLATTVVANVYLVVCHVVFTWH